MDLTGPVSPGAGEPVRHPGCGDGTANGPGTPPGASALLSLQHASKSFGAVHAVIDGSLTLHGGEVHALAAAQVLDTPKYRGKIALTGLGTPDAMKKYVADGTVQAFELWNPANLGYLAAYAAVDLASNTITNAQGQTFTAGKLGTYTVGADHSVLLGPPLVFNSSNISNFNF